jgi:hypothetical protein
MQAMIKMRDEQPVKKDQEKAENRGNFEKGHFSVLLMMSLSQMHFSAALDGVVTRHVIILPSCKT